jgi:o-succinylbenzoate synthase
MNNLELTYSPYQLELKSSFETAHGKIDVRKGFIISIKNSKGIEGIGDTAPFPEIGSESLEDAERALKNIKLDLKIELTNIRESFKELLNDYDSLPSLRHGIEQALLNLICKEKNVTIDKLLELNLKRVTNVNASIGFLQEDETILKAKKLIEKGFKTLKIKAGMDNFEDEYNWIKAVRDEFGNDVTLRIDANGKWELDEAVKYLLKLEDLNLEYAEQPVNSLDNFITLKNSTLVPLAADESIRTKKAAEDFIKKNAVDYLILKPMIIGGLLPTLEIIELAEKNNITPVITSSFESAVGKANAVIAAAIVKKDTAHGLALTDYFKKDVISDPFPIKNGKITLSD